MLLLVLSYSEPYEASYVFTHFHGLALCPVFHCAVSCPTYLPPVHLVMTVALLASSLSAPTQLKVQNSAGHTQGPGIPALNLPQPGPLQKY